MIYTNVSRGLFEKDKLNYAFLITTSIARDAKKIDETVWNLLLRGPSVFSPEEKKAMLASPDSILIPPLQWDTLYSAELRS
jgi:dynein heavy chain